MKTELLMPAGSLEKLQYALHYGADAVYAGVPLFSLRARENEMTFEDLDQGIRLAHSMGKKVYLTANIFARNLKLKPFEKHVAQMMELNADGIIMSDPGLMMIVRDINPHLPIHLSVQANCMNWQNVKFWQKQGVTRVILSRELRLTEIAEIHQKVPDIELEAFVHGSICIAYSGRCLLSHYMSHRDANQGVCDNSCRYGYNVHKAEPTAEEAEFFLEDLRDKGKFYRIDEDEHGTYIMNAKDLCLIEHLKELQDAGVVSFKVEGRTKSVHYAAMISKIYREALNDAEAGKPFNPQLLVELDKVANRGYHKGFLMGQPTHEAQEYNHSVSRHFSQKFAGITQKSDDGRVIVEVRNKLLVGDTLEVITPKASFDSKIVSIQKETGEAVEAAHGGAGRYYLELDHSVAQYGELAEHSLLSCKL
jgi:putative protease